LGNTPLHYAAEAGKADCFNCLMHHGGDIARLNIAQATPIDSAKRKGHPVLINKAGNKEAQHYKILIVMQWRLNVVDFEQLMTKLDAKNV
jgi:ankyrin repeat protein